MTRPPAREPPGKTAAAETSSGSSGPSPDDPGLAEVGVGPYSGPWPDDPRLDPELLARGDRRNVVDRYRYWRVDAIVADLDARRHPFHVAVENWRHDLNIGTVVRNANAFLAAAVHIVGRPRWNRRGAMVTERFCCAPSACARSRVMTSALSEDGEARPPAWPMKSHTAAIPG